MKRFFAVLLAAALTAATLTACGGGAQDSHPQQSATYEAVMARFDGKLEKGAVVQVLENDTAIELG